MLELERFVAWRGVACVFLAAERIMGALQMLGRETHGGRS